MSKVNIDAKTTPKPMDVPRLRDVHRLDRQSVLSLPNYVTKTASVAALPSLRNSMATLDNLSIHSDDVTTTRGCHVSRKSGGGILHRFSHAIQERLTTKRHSLDCLTEAIAINHANPGNVLLRCASCLKMRTNQGVAERRISLVSSSQLEQIDGDPMDYSRRNFTSHLSPVSLSHCQARTDISLSNVSPLPLAIDIRNNQLDIYVDGARRYCRRCSRNRICVPYHIGVVDLPPYLDTDSITLTFVQKTDTLIVEGATKGIHSVTTAHINGSTKPHRPKLVKIRSL